MKYVLTIILFLSHIIRANFINNGATLTIDEGVTVIANGSFENATGTLSNNGTLEISGNFINSHVSNFGSSSSLNLIGDNQSISGGTYNNIVVDGSGAKTMLDDVTVNGSLTLSSGYCFTLVHEVWIFLGKLVPPVRTRTDVGVDGVLKLIRNHRVGYTGAVCSLSFSFSISL